MTQNHGSAGRRIEPLAAVVVTTFLGFTGFFLLRPVVPLYARGVGASVIEVGLITVVLGVSTMVGAVPMGVISDRLARWRLVSLGLLLLALGSVVLYFSRSTLMLMVASVVAGLGWSALEPALSASVADISRAERLGRTFGTYSTAVQIASSVGPAVGGTLVALWGFQETFLVSAGILFAAALWSTTMTGVGSIRTSETTGQIEKERSFRSKGAVVSGWLGICFSFVITTTLFTYMPLYASDRGIGIAIIGILFSVHAVASLFLRLPIGTLSDRFQRKAPYLALGLSISSITIILAPFTSNVIALAGLFILLAVGRAMTNPLSNVLVIKGAGEKSRGFAMGILTSFRHGGEALGPGVAGPLIGVFGYSVGFPAVALLGFSGVLIILWAGRRN